VRRRRAPINLAWGVGRDGDARGKHARNWRGGDMARLSHCMSGRERGPFEEEPGTHAGGTLEAWAPCFSLIRKGQLGAAAC
jgi:hypothetical protein